LSVPAHSLKLLMSAFSSAGLQCSHEEASILLSRLYHARFDNGSRQLHDPFDVFSWEAVDFRIFVNDYITMTDNEFRENYYIEREV